MKVCVFTESFSEKSLQSNKHQVKSVDIRSFSGPFFRVLGLNMEIYFVNLRIYSVNLCIQSKRMDQENSEYVHVLHGVCFLIVEELSVKTEILQLESCCPQAFYKFNFSETSSETSVVEPIVAL